MNGLTDSLRAKIAELEGKVSDYNTQMVVLKAERKKAQKSLKEAKQALDIAIKLLGNSEIAS